MARLHPGSVSLWWVAALVACTPEAGPVHLAPKSDPRPRPTLVEPPPVDPAAGAQERAAAELRRLDEEAQARAEAERAAFEAAYPLHGMVFHFVAQVFPDPSRARANIGYMRRGSTFRAAPGVSGPGCALEWHEVPGGGFVCRGEGFLIGDGPQTFEPIPPPPALSAALPYSYSYTARDFVPQYWRLPSLAEEARAAEIMGELAERARPVDAGVAPATATAALDGGTAATALDGGTAATEPTTGSIAPPEPHPPGTSAAASAVPVPDAGRAEVEPGESRAATEAVSAPPPPGLEALPALPVPLAPMGADAGGVVLPEFLRAPMRTGFYVSIDRRERTELGRLFFRTIRGAYVRATDVLPNEPPTSRGVVLGGEWELPIAIVFRSGVRSLRRGTGRGARLMDEGVLARHTALVVVDDNLVYRGRRYVLGQGGRLVREPSVRVISSIARPRGVPEDALWIHVKLSTQTLVAYEGNVPVFATLVSTGKEGFETPSGLFRIQSKHLSTTMDDPDATEGAYSIEDVPWTMYFDGNYALHGAFWHYTFGHVRSHGCVNLAPADARWLFFWTTPTLPDGWHGMFSDPRSRPGTFVYVEGDPPS